MSTRNDHSLSYRWVTGDAAKPTNYLSERCSGFSRVVQTYVRVRMYVLCPTAIDGCALHRAAATTARALMLTAFTTAAVITTITTTTTTTTVHMSAAPTRQADQVANIKS